MGTHGLVAGAALAATAAKSSSSNYSFLLIILVLFGVMYFVMIRPQRNKQRQAQQTQRQVGDGARVRTTAGMYGTIIEGDADNVLVEFAPGVRIKMMRRAIMNVVPDDEPIGFNATMPDMGDSDTTFSATGDSTVPARATDDRGDLAI
jgi:preprotein translocase subunit YajC